VIIGLSYERAQAVHETVDSGGEFRRGRARAYRGTGDRTLDGGEMVMYTKREEMVGANVPDLGRLISRENVIPSSKEAS
jgi:hypothetical protein